MFKTTFPDPVRVAVDSYQRLRIPPGKLMSCRKEGLEKCTRMVLTASMPGKLKRQRSYNYYVSTPGLKQIEIQTYSNHPSMQREEKKKNGRKKRPKRTTAMSPDPDIIRKLLLHSAYNPSMIELIQGIVVCYQGAARFLLLRFHAAPPPPPLFHPGGVGSRFHADPTGSASRFQADVGTRAPTFDFRLGYFPSKWSIKNVKHTSPAASRASWTLRPSS